MAINFKDVRPLLEKFEFGEVFAEHLGWSRPAAAERKWQPFEVKGDAYERRAVAELGGVFVFEVRSGDARIPGADRRLQVFREIARLHHEHLLIFVDAQKTQSLWYWVKRDGKQQSPRSHLYVRGQPGDLLIGKLDAMHFDIAELDEVGNAPVVEVARRLRDALDVEKVTKRFYADFQKLHESFVGRIKHVRGESDRRWYASVLLNRLMFVYFLQKRGFVLGNQSYLQQKLNESKERGKNQFFSTFLKTLFFDGFAKPESMRSPATDAFIGRVRYLNGGLFLPHKVEQNNLKLDVPDDAFDEAFDLFKSYDWHLDDTPGGDDRQINPDVLGYIFEKYINQKEFGAYYTRPEITNYLCEKTIYRRIREKLPHHGPIHDGENGATVERYESDDMWLLQLDDNACRRLIRDILPNFSVLDPACGSGAFLVAAMKTLIAIYSAVIGRIKTGSDDGLKAQIAQWEKEHRSLGYFIRREIISKNLFGVDLMEEATEIAKLRLFLALVSVANSEDQLEPLPNIDFNILQGNALIGLLEVKDVEFDRDGTALLFKPSDQYRKAVDDKDRQEDTYRGLSAYTPNLTALRDGINKLRDAAALTLNGILLERFVKLGIKYEQATWQDGEEGRPEKRALRTKDITSLTPLHWAYEFNRIFRDGGGFDVIVMNPPWDAFKPDAKEFFQEHSELVSKKTMTIKEFEKEQAKLLKDPEIQDAWLDYLSRFPHVSAYYRGASQFTHQSSIVNGRKVAGDVNLYKLFVEQCFNLLAPGGQAGIVVPAGVYNDQGAKALREMLFDDGELRVLFGFSNEKYLFEEVHHSVKFAVLAFGKGGKTHSFEAAFRINPREAIKAEQLDAFLRDRESHVRLTPELVRQLSPSTVSIMEFRGPLDIEIVQKMMQFPALETASESGWKLELGREFDMTNDSDLFEPKPARGRLPLYEGKLLHQYRHLVGEPKYWIDEKAGRARILGREEDAEQELDYQQYRLAFRDVARNTDERTMIATVLPQNVFCPHTVTLEKVGTLDVWSRFYLLALFNSFSVDYLLRQRVNAHVSFFFVYNLPIPRLPSTDPKLRSIALRAAKLVCTGPEFDDLARQVGLRDHRDGATEFADRKRLRAEIDGLVAHLYGLTEVEFAHILKTFPVVPDPDKVAAHNAYRDVRTGYLK